MKNLLLGIWPHQKKEKLLSVQQHPFSENLWFFEREGIFTCGKHVKHRSAEMQAPSWVIWSHVSESRQSKLFWVTLFNLPMPTPFYIMHCCKYSAFRSFRFFRRFKLLLTSYSPCITLLWGKESPWSLLSYES